MERRNGAEFLHYGLSAIQKLFVVPGNMTTDRRMKRISVPGPRSCFRHAPAREYPFHPPIRCHVSEPVFILRVRDAAFNITRSISSVFRISMSSPRISSFFLCDVISTLRETDSDVHVDQGRGFPFAMLPKR